MRNISATRYSCYDTCQLQYKFNYILKLMKLPSDALEIGTLYHSSIENYDKGVGILDLLNDITISGLDSSNSEMLKGMIHKYVENPVKGNVLETEYKFSFNVPGVPIPIIGYIDRIDEDKGVEHKTSSFDYKDKDTETIQADIYSYALREKFGKMMPIMYAVNNKKKYKSKKYIPQQILIQRTDKDMDELEKKLLTFYKNESISKFNPSPGIHCYWCSWGTRAGDGTCPYSK